MAIELRAAWQHLRAVGEHYGDPEWRRDHNGFGIDPETSRLQHRLVARVPTQHRRLSPGVGRQHPLKSPGL